MRLGLGPHLLDDLATLAKQASYMLPWHDEPGGHLTPVPGVLASGPVLAVLIPIIRLRLQDPPVHHEERLLRRREHRRAAVRLAQRAVGRLDDADRVPGEGRVDSDDRAAVILGVVNEAGREAVGLRLRAQDAEGGGRAGTPAPHRRGGSGWRRGRERGRCGVRGEEAAAAVGGAAAASGGSAAVVVGVRVRAAAPAAAVEAGLGAGRRRVLVVVVPALRAGAIHCWIPELCVRFSVLVRFDLNPVRSMRCDVIRI